jgi:hypothetical protein
MDLYRKRVGGNELSQDIIKWQARVNMLHHFKGFLSSESMHPAWQTILPVSNFHNGFKTCFQLIVCLPLLPDAGGDYCKTVLSNLSSSICSV